MKFNKALLIGINETQLGMPYWQRINGLIKNKVFLPKDSPKISENLKTTDCLLVGFGIALTKEDIDIAQNLKYIGVLATAYGKIDTNYAKKKGITICNLPGYSTESVAEFVLAVVLEQIRGLEEGKRRVRAGDVSEAGILTLEIKNKIFGVIGLGSIGSRVAEIALGFGADVRYWSRNKKKKEEKKGIKYESLDSLVLKADILSINLAQTPETEKVMDKKRFLALKKGSVVVNTAPMELVDFDALAKRLAKKDITFIFDHSDEMKKEDLQRLSKFENCVIYPPMAYITPEAAINRQEMFTSNLENFLKGKSTNAV